MRKKDVAIGKTYAVNVAGRLVPVRVDATSPYGGWVGTNVFSGRRIRLRTAARLRFEVVQRDDGRWYRATPRHTGDDVRPSRPKTTPSTTPSTG